MFDDGSHIIYVNGSYRGDSPIGKLMEDFACQKPDEMHYQLLANRSRYLKEEKEGVWDMCKIMEELINDRIKEEEQKTAKKMLHKGKLSLEEIAEYSGLTLEEVKTLKLQLV